MRMLTGALLLVGASRHLLMLIWCSSPNHIEARTVLMCRLLRHCWSPES